jgi:hypothetical protein
VRIVREVDEVTAPSVEPLPVTHVVCGSLYAASVGIARRREARARQR